MMPRIRQKATADYASLFSFSAAFFIHRHAARYEQRRVDTWPTQKAPSFMHSAAAPAEPEATLSHHAVVTFSDGATNPLPQRAGMKIETHEDTSSSQEPPQVADTEQYNTLLMSCRPPLFPVHTVLQPRTQASGEYVSHSLS